MSADQYDRKTPVMDPWCPNCRQPWPTPEQEALRKSAEEYFAAYFENNYYGTVVFSDPRWHAPRVFRAALWALQQAKKDAETSTPETRTDTPRPCPVCDSTGGHAWNCSLNQV